MGQHMQRTGMEDSDNGRKNTVGDYDRNHGEDEHGPRDNGNDGEHEGDRTGRGHHKPTTTNERRR